MRLSFQLVPFLALAMHVRAHGVLTAVTGTNGVAGQGFGVVATTPRDGTKRNPFQQDTSIIRDKEIAKGDAGVCGRTLAGGDNDVATQLNAAVAAGLPSADADGTVTMTLHQVNGDGAGPYTCEVSTDATGASFAAMTVTTNVPGRNSRSNAKATDFALVAQMPAGSACTGGATGDACLVRCRNAARAGPFGGCVAVTNADSGNATASTVSADASASESAIDSAAAVDTASVDTGSATASAATASGTALAEDDTVDDTEDTEDDTEDTEDDTEDTEDDSAVASGGATASGTTKASKASKAKSVAGNFRLARDTESNDQEDDDVSIHDAEIALAADLDRRLAERVRRSRIFGRRAL